MTQNKIDTTQNILQYVSTSSTSTFVTVGLFTTAVTAIPTNTEGDQIITLAITPKFTTSNLEIIFHAQVDSDAVGRTLEFGLYQDSTVNALAAVLYKPSTRNSFIFSYIMTSGTTSSTTFKIRAGARGIGSANINCDSAGTRLMGGVSSLWLTITEYL